jgi:hypothetical protein
MELGCYFYFLPPNNPLGLIYILTIYMHSHILSLHPNYVLATSKLPTYLRTYPLPLPRSKPISTQESDLLYHLLPHLVCRSLSLSTSSNKLVCISLNFIHFTMYAPLKLLPMEMGLGSSKFWLRIVQLSTPPNHQIVMLLGMCFKLCVCFFCEEQ